MMLDRSLVLRIILTTWRILSKIAFDCCFFIVANVGLTEKYLSNGPQFLLNSDPLSEITLRGLGYLESHTSLNIRYIMAKDWSMIGNYEISNYPVAVSTKVMHNSWKLFVTILLSGSLNLASIVYVIMRYIHTVYHGFKVLTYLSWSNPYLELRLLNFWHPLQDLKSLRAYIH